MRFPMVTASYETVHNQPALPTCNNKRAGSNATGPFIVNVEMKLVQRMASNNSRQRFSVAGYCKIRDLLPLQV